MDILRYLSLVIFEMLFLTVLLGCIRMFVSFHCLFFLLVRMMILLFLLLIVKQELFKIRLIKLILL